MLQRQLIPSSSLVYSCSHSGGAEKERQTEWCCVFFDAAVVLLAVVKLASYECWCRWCWDRSSTWYQPSTALRESSNFSGYFTIRFEVYKLTASRSIPSTCFRMNWTTAIYCMASTNSPRNAMLGTRSDCDLFNERDLSRFPVFRTVAKKVTKWNVIHGGGTRIGIEAVWWTNAIEDKVNGFFVNWCKRTLRSNRWHDCYTFEK